MIQLTIDKITKIYCIADDFRKKFSKEIKKYQILPNDGKRLAIQEKKLKYKELKIKQI
jgi:hypothetical protein